MKRSKIEYKFFIVISIFVGLRISLLATDYNSLLKNFLIDDTFYYLELSRNMADGNIVFNKNVPTNGFHFLLPLLLTPIYFFNLGELGVLSVLTISSLSQLASGILVYKFVKALISRQFALISGSLWLFHPFVTKISLTGMESMIQSTLFAATFYTLYTQDFEPKSLRSSVWIGILASLSILARMDSVLLLAPLFFLMLYEIISHEFKLKNLVNSAAAIVLPVVTVAIWMTWSFFYTGFLTPVSGKAIRHIRLMNHTNYVEALIFGLRNSAWNVSKFIIPGNWQFGILDPLLSVISVFAVSAMILTSIFGNKQEFRRVGYVIASGMIIWSIYYSLVGLGTRFYYFSIPIFYFVIGSAIGFSKFRKKPEVLDSGLMFALFSIFIVINGMNGVFPTAPQELTKYEIAVNLDDRNTYGSFNTGIYDYHSETDVKNLDGVMNVKTYRMSQNGTLEQYVERNIDYIIDKPKVVENRLPKLNFQILDSYSISESDEKYSLIKVSK